MATVDFATPFMPVIVMPPLGMALEGFRTWLYSNDFPERGRVAFIGGRLIIETGPQPIWTHNQIEAENNYVIGGIVRQEKLGDYYPARARMTNCAAEISTQPDGIFASWETLKIGKLGPPKDRSLGDDYIELAGTPDWVCEVVSDTSVEKDTESLVQAYHMAGVREYWLIDARGEDIDFQVLVWTEAGYQAAESRDGWRASRVFGREFQLVRFRNEAGHWEYELRQRKT